MPSDRAYRQAGNGLRYLTPELVVLFKAKHCRPRDQHDVDVLLPDLDAEQRARLLAWLERSEPGHRWLDAL